MLTTASTEVSASAGRSACHCGSLAVSPARVAKCPPAEHPAATMKLGSPPKWSTLACAHAMAALTSVIWRGQRCRGLVRYWSDKQTQPLLTKWAISACPCNARLPNTHAPPGMKTSTGAGTPG